MKYFKDTEFVCTCPVCDGKVESQIEIMSPEILEDADAIREVLGEPVTVRSGYRCSNHVETKKWMSKYPTKPLSMNNHYAGYAWDFTYDSLVTEDYTRAVSKLRRKLINGNDVSHFKIIKIVKALGYNRIGLGPDFVHVDKHPDKPIAIWTYY